MHPADLHPLPSSPCLPQRDLKPQNLLLSEASANATLKIADFGFARNLQPQVRACGLGCRALWSARTPGLLHACLCFGWGPTAAVMLMMRLAAWLPRRSTGPG